MSLKNLPPKLFLLAGIVVLTVYTGLRRRTKARRKNAPVLVSLSHEIHEHIPLWPGDPRVEFDNVNAIETDGYFLRRFSMGEHSGTHVNAPNSFIIGGEGIDAYATAKLVVPAIVIDLRNKCAEDSDYSLACIDIEEWESVHGRIPSGSLVILFSGWQEKWNDSAMFFNMDVAGKMHFPGFSADAATMLITQRSVAGLGTDAHGVDPGIDSEFYANRIALKEKLIVIECLTRLDRLPPKGAAVYIGILALKGGSGSPASVIAVVPS